MKVAKFGGSSLADAHQFERVANIIKDDEERKFIVVSAPGNRHDHDVKITDLLMQLGTAYIKEEIYKSYYITIVDRFAKIRKDLQLPEALNDEIENRLQEIMRLSLPFEEH